MSAGKLYGWKDQERLEHDTPEEVLLQHLDDAALPGADNFDAVAGRITWPVKVYEFAPMRPPFAEDIAQDALEHVLEGLEEYSDPDGDGVEPTAAQQVAALDFARAIVADYPWWAHEETGKVVEFTREQARALDAEHHGPSPAKGGGA